MGGKSSSSSATTNLTKNESLGDYSEGNEGLNLNLVDSGFDNSTFIVTDQNAISEANETLREGIESFENINEEVQDTLKDSFEEANKTVRETFEDANETVQISIESNSDTFENAMDLIDSTNEMSFRFAEEAIDEIGDQVGLALQFNQQSVEKNLNTASNLAKSETERITEAAIKNIGMGLGIFAIAFYLKGTK